MFSSTFILVGRFHCLLAVASMILVLFLPCNSCACCIQTKVSNHLSSLKCCAVYEVQNQCNCCFSEDEKEHFSLDHLQNKNCQCLTDYPVFFIGSSYVINSFSNELQLNDIKNHSADLFLSKHLNVSFINYMVFYKLGFNTYYPPCPTNLII